MWSVVRHLDLCPDIKIIGRKLNLEGSIGCCTERMTPINFIGDILYDPAWTHRSAAGADALGSEERRFMTWRLRVFRLFILPRDIHFKDVLCVSIVDQLWGQECTKMLISRRKV